MHPSTAGRTPESELLVALARRVAAVYARHTGPAAVLLVGSAAEGISDEYSDLDLCLYYQNDAPADNALDMARAELSAANPSLLAPRSDRGVVETFLLDGIDCQLSHVTIAAFLEDIDAVLVRHEAGSITQKLLEGLVHGIPIAGDDLVAGWQARAREYPEELKLAMVRHFLTVRPIWYLSERLSGRDAQLFLHQMRIDATLNILGILAGLNGVYFSTFQFKRMGRFAEHLVIAPPDLASRLQWAFEVDPEDAADMIEEIATETLRLVRTHAPEVDISAIRYPPGTRQTPWKRDAAPTE